MTDGQVLQHVVATESK